MVNLLFDLAHVNLGDGALAVKDAGDFLERRSLCLDVDKVNKAELYRVPDGVEQHKVPVVGKALPGELVGLTVVTLVSGSSVDGREDNTYLPIARTAWTVMFIIIIPLARKWKGSTSRA